VDEREGKQVSTIHCDLLYRVRGGVLCGRQKRGAGKTRGKEKTIHPAGTIVRELKDSTRISRSRTGLVRGCDCQSAQITKLQC